MQRKPKVLAVIFAVLSVFTFGVECEIWDNQPGKTWENSWYPLGNGRLGCMVDGGVKNLKIQFNVDSLWTGDKNLTKDIHDNRADANYSTMGAYQNFGELNIAIEGLGEGDKAGEMLESLLKYNTLDNMFATHPPFQIDGNLGLVGAVCEILLEKSIPSEWKSGSVKGLRTREGKTIDFSW